MSRLGELLVRENLISLQQLQKAQEDQKKSGTRLGYSLTKLSIIEEQQLTTFLSKQYAGAPLIVAMADPSNIYAIDDLKFRTGLNIDVAVASEGAIEEAIVRYYEK